MRTLVLKDFIYGQIDTLEDRSIPRGSASKALNWVTAADRIELRRGYNVLGNTVAGGGSVPSLEVVRTSSGTEIRLRTRGKKLEYYKVSNDTWTEIGTDILGSAAEDGEISIEEYHTLAGDAIYVNSPNGPYLKIMMANIDDYTDLYDSAKNYKGRIKIKQNRTFLWGRNKDKTAIYMSYIDSQNYTTVSNENIGTGNGSTKTFNDTLVFKAGEAKGTCFGIVVTDTVEIFTDNFDGTLTGDQGGTGTINYMTGEISVTFNTAPGNAQAILCDYQWVDDTDEGIADFTFTTPTRVAAEGNIFRQDGAGGNLQSIESYGDDEYCLHEKKTWVLTLSSDDTNATNLVYRDRVGIPNWRASVSTADGIYFIDNSDKKDPQIRLITIPPLFTKAIPVSISKGKKYKNKQVGIDLSPYLFDKTVGFEWGDLILFSCRTTNSTQNNRVVVYNKVQRTIDVHDYWVSSLAIYEGTLIAGDPLTPNVYTLFSGFDDDDSEIINEWEGNRDNLDFNGTKKEKRFVIKGLIALEQTLKISASIDNGPFVELGRVEGDGDYVDRSSGVSIGRVTIGQKEVGGGGDGAVAYNYERLIKLKLDSFSTIKIRFEALGLGYISVSELQHKDIRIKSDKIPKKYRP